MTGSASLLVADDSILVVVDVQPGFLARLGPDRADPLVERIAWLVRVAVTLEVPVIATEEEPERHGSTHPLVASSLPSTVRPRRKAVFGLADQPDILTAVESTGRRTVILVGLETDVCVCHSALGLADRGYRVAVPEDATGSPGDGHAAGVARMGAAGVLVSTTKALFYEWTRTVERASALVEGVPPPDGLAL